MSTQAGRLGIIGCGNMGEAILRGLMQGGNFPLDGIIVSARHQERIDALAERHGVATTLENSKVAASASIVVLAVKPQIARTVLEEISPAISPDTLLVSVVAGLSMDGIIRTLGKPLPVVRAMPNTPALVHAGATAISSNGQVTKEQHDLVSSMFGSLGKVVTVDEAQMNAVTGLSGSGPAYVFLMIDALADAGVHVGLSRNESLVLAAQTVMGSAKLLLDSGEHPGRLKDMVTSPGGTAIAGVATLEAGGIRTTLIRAVEVATHRCEELGKALNGER